MNGARKKAKAGAGVCLALVLGLFPLSGRADSAEGTWVVDSSYQPEPDRVWQAASLHNPANSQPTVCALNYRTKFPGQKVAHPFVLLVSEMSKEFWTTDREWQLSPHAEGKVKLLLDGKIFPFAVDPENEFIFMSLIAQDQIEAILTQLQEAKKAEITLSSRRLRKKVALPLKGLPPVIEAFRKCMATPLLNKAAKVPVAKDKKLTKEFKA